MTAWQDQPPQTRRQLRLSEQRDGAREDGTESANPEEHVNVRLEDVRREDENGPFESGTRPGPPEREASEVLHMDDVRLQFLDPAIKGYRGA